MNDETKNRDLVPLVAGGGRPLAIIPQNVEQAYRQAQFAVAGEFAPKGWSVEMAVSAIMMGAECGMRPMMSMQRICVINGRPSVWGDAVLGIAMATGQLEDWSERIEGAGDNRVAICTVRRRGLPTPVVKTFSVAMAKEAGLWGKAGPWKSYPERMLAMRARVAFRDAFADAFSGLYIAEELQGVPMRDVTPGANEEDFVTNPLGGDDEAEQGRVVSHEEGARMIQEPEPDDGAVVNRDGSVTRQEPAHASGTGKVAKQRPPRKNAPAKPSGAGQALSNEESEAVAAAAREHAPPPAHPDTVPLPPSPARWGGEHYVTHVRSWAVAAFSYACANGEFRGETYLRDRWKKETALRNNLGTPLTAEERDEATAVLSNAVAQIVALRQGNGDEAS